MCCGLVVLAQAQAAGGQSAADIAAALRQVSLDPEQSYRVRDLELTRGDIKIYLTEGVLSFVRPVAGRCIAAVFTTEGVEAGDAEVLVLPPDRAERASLASSTKSPNLDEHFSAAAFFFSDDSDKEFLNQIESKPVRKTPELARQLKERLDPMLENVSQRLDVRLVQALLDNHQPARGFFYGLIGGRDLGNFAVMYEPNDFEPISIGRPAFADEQEKFELWTSFRPRHAPPYVEPTPRASDYRIDTTIHPDLSMSVEASFHLITDESAGRVIPLGLSERLKVESATVDGRPAEVFQRDNAEMTKLKGGRTFLLVLDKPVSAGTPHTIDIRYDGSVIRQTHDGSYFVDERNVWFPYTGATMANFDLTFRCPARLRLVSTGEPVSDEVRGDQRVVHRKTQVPEPLAGFNLGDYEVTTEAHGAYRVECYANRSSGEAMADIPNQTENVLDYYTGRWMKLPIQSVAVSPIPGYFGQGFPGLIYLSTISYMLEKDRPVALRNARLDAFFTQLLLPHEAAHQWWGDIVSAADYRAGWIMEAMANDSALEFVGHTQGAAAVRAVLDSYRDDLTYERNGKTLDAAGPLDLGARLRDTANEFTWHVITYEKGSWVLHMLRQRLGDEAFTRMQMRLLEQFRTKPMTNEDFRKVASEFMPPGEPDKTLALFFDTWVYGTGVPKFALKQTKNGLDLEVSAVDDDFSADVPLRCQSADGKQRVHWVRASAGENDLELPRAAASCSLPSPDDFLYLQ